MEQYKECKVYISNRYDKTDTTDTTKATAMIESMTRGE